MNTIDLPVDLSIASRQNQHSTTDWQQPRFVTEGAVAVLLESLNVRRPCWRVFLPEMLEPEQILPWYAIRVKSNCERGVAISLRARGYEDFLPTYRSQRTWSDRHKTIDLPLFPGYVFCRFDVGRRQPVISTPGVVSILGVGRTPMPVPDEEVEAVQKIIGSGLIASPWPFLRIGDRVLIERGPLTGIEGSLIEVKKSLRLVVSIELLQRSIAAEIDKSWVRPIESGSFRSNN